MTACTVACLLMLESKMKLGWISSLVLIVVAYGGQDLAHYVTGEKTYQSSYSDGGQIDLTNLDFWISQFYEHCFYLLPLCADLVLRPLQLDLDTKYKLNTGLNMIYDNVSSTPGIVTMGMLGLAVLSYEVSSTSSSSKVEMTKRRRPRVVRVWTDMVGDLFHQGHMSLIRNARRRVEKMHPDGEVWVGVGIHSDKLVRSFHRNPVMTMEERVSAVRAAVLPMLCIRMLPWNHEGIHARVGSFTADRHKIDYVAVDGVSPFMPQTRFVTCFWIAKRRRNVASS